MAAVRGGGGLLLLACLAAPMTGRGEGAREADAERASPPESFWTWVGASGSVRGDYLSSDNALTDEADLFAAAVQLKASPTFGDVLRARAEGRILLPDATRLKRRGPSATLLEGYLDVHAWRVDARIGKQNVAWGRADGINPTDNLTPRDFKVALPFDDDQRFGSVAVTIDIHLTPDYALTLFATPFFAPSQIPLPLPAGAVVVGERRPGRALSNGEVGLRLNRSNAETDWSLSYYHGFSLVPEVGLAGVVPPATVRLELRYPRIDVLGADVATSLGEYGVRAEAAFVVPRDPDQEHPTVLRRYAYCVLGVERNLLGTINVNVQVVVRAVPRFQDWDAIPDPLARTIALKNAILFGQRHQINLGVTSRVGGRWLSDTLEAEVQLVAYFDAPNALLRPIVKYALTDRVKASVGAALYMGAQDTFFGSLGKNKGAFAEVRYAF